MILLLCAVLILALQVILLLRAGRGGDLPALLQRLQSELQRQQQDGGERLEREIRAQQQAVRQELGGNFAQFQQTLAAQLTSVATVQNSQIDGFAQQLVKLNATNTQQLESMRQSMSLQAQAAREEQAVSLKRFGDTLNQTLERADRIECAADGRGARHAGSEDPRPAAGQRLAAGGNAQDGG